MEFYLTNYNPNCSPTGTAGFSIVLTTNLPVNSTSIPSTLAAEPPITRGGLPNPSIAFIAGVTFYILLFRRGEWDISTNRISAGLLILQVAMFCYAVFVKNPASALSDGIWFVTMINTRLVAGLSVSILLYRTISHRFNSFPES